MSSRSSSSRTRKHDSKSNPKSKSSGTSKVVGESRAKERRGDHRPRDREKDKEKSRQSKTKSNDSREKGSKKSGHGGEKPSKRKTSEAELEARRFSEAAAEVLAKETVEEDEDGVVDEINYEDDFDDFDEDQDGEVETHGNVFAAEAIDGDGGYDDDDYDDFEGDDDEEEEEDVVVDPSVIAAMRSENAKVKSPNATMEHEESPVNHEFKARVNFGNARHAARSNAMKKNERRYRELRKLIELDVIDGTLFEQAPMSEYELYMRNYGNSNTVQTGCQASEQSSDNSCQTDRIKMKTRWTQEPATGLIASARDDGGYDSDEDRQSAGAQRKMASSQLSKFLERAGPVCSALLDENIRALPVSTDDGAPELNRQIRFCDSTSLLDGRCVVSSAFCDVKSELIATAYGEDLSSSSIFKDEGFICVWNSNDPSVPLHYLTCESIPSCCCFDPYKGTILVAATHDGTLSLWDLREASTLHKQKSVNEQKIRVRQPTYSTEGIVDAENHVVPIVAIHPIAVAGQEGGSGSSSFQLATLDTDGVLKTWTVVELTNADPTGSLHELGLLPGGRVKLSPSGSIRLDLSHYKQEINMYSESLLQTHCFELYPNFPNRFIVGTNQGAIIHGVRFGNRISPRIYALNGSPVTDVNSVSFNQHLGDFFLAGFKNGSIGLFHISTPNAIEVWSNSCGSAGVGVKMICWSRDRPAVFFVLGDNETLYLWDLLANKETFVDRLNLGAENTVGICVNRSTARTRDHYDYAVSKNDGSVEIYRLQEPLRAPKDSVDLEADKLQEYFNNLYY